MGCSNCDKNKIEIVMAEKIILKSGEKECEIKVINTVITEENITYIQTREKKQVVTYVITATNYKIVGDFMKNNVIDSINIDEKTFYNCSIIDLEEKNKFQIKIING